MSNETIKLDDPRHAAAMRVLDAMHDFWNLCPFDGAVQWIEDADGRVVVFTRGEYRDKMMQAIPHNLKPTQYFELEPKEPDHES